MEKRFRPEDKVFSINRVRVIVAWLLIGICLASSLAGCGGHNADWQTHGPTLEVSADATSPALYHYEAKKEGSFEGDRLEFDQRSGAIVRRDGDDYFVVGPDGTNVCSAAAKETKPLEDDMVVIESRADGPNRIGAVDTVDGEVIPPEAAVIEWADCQGGDHRFCAVTYATEPTDEESKAAVVVRRYGQTDVASRAGGYLGDYVRALYEGYTKIYDVKKKGFVTLPDNVDKHAAFYDLGESLLAWDVQHDSARLFDSKGKELWNGSGVLSLSVGAHSFCVAKGTSYELIDNQGKVQHTHKEDGYVHSLYGPDDYYTVTSLSDDKTYVIDLGGEVVMEPIDCDYVRECNGLFELRDEPKVVDSEGRLVAEGQLMDSPLEGYVTLQALDGDEGRMLLCGSEQLARGLELGEANDLVFRDDDSNYYVFATHACSLKLEGGYGLDKALVCGSSEQDGDHMGVYDLFTGEEVIPATYSRFITAGNRIYAFDEGDNKTSEGVWDVYTVKRIRSTATAS